MIPSSSIYEVPVSPNNICQYHPGSTNLDIHLTLKDSLYIMILVLTDLGPDAVGRGDQPPRVDEGGAAVGGGADQPCDIAWGHVMCHVSCVM